MPTCWIIAGPNGAGKTTFALEYLPSVAQCQRFINADLIAAGLSPLAPEQQLLAASRLFLHEIEECIAAQQDFAFETTLAERVAHGGHDIPTRDIERRFPRSLENLFNLFAPLVNQTRCFMNSGDVPKLVFQQNGTQRVIFHPKHFELLSNEVKS